MYCSTCGALVPTGRRACSECGTPVTQTVSRMAGYAPAPAADAARVPTTPALASCPRCGYRGEGLPYFARGSHMAFLVGLVVLTAGMMGAGGLIYYLVRRDHRVCPRCGLGWGREGELTLSRAHAPGESAPMAVDSVLARRESRKQGVSVLLMLLAAILAVAGIVQWELMPVMLAVLVAGVGWTLNRSARAEREVRRATLLASLQLPVLRLAEQRGGRLTVTEVAAQLGWPLRRAEKVLLSMDDGYRVSSDVTDEGVLVYEFLELRHRPDRLPQGQD